MKLSQSLSTWTLLTSAIAGIVGSGWLLGPLACARIAGPAAILTWIVGGFLMMIVASTFVLLVRAIPITGGTVRFFQLSYGHFAGFSFSWITWLAWLAVSPIETMALIQYSSNYIPALMTKEIEPVLTPLGLSIAVGLMTFIVFINNYGMRIYSRISNFIVLFKLAIPTITVVLLYGTQFNPHNFINYNGFMPYGIHSIFAALPLAGVIYSYIGFNPAIQLAAEATNPKRAIPIAVFSALAICTILYASIQATFIAALPENLLKTNWSQLTFVGNNGPFVGLLASLGFTWFIKTLYVDAIISPFGTAMVQAVSAGRLTYAMGQNGYLPKKILKTNRKKIPMHAMIINLLIGLILFLPFPNWQHMVSFLVSCLVLGYIVGPMSLAILSKKQPEKFATIPQKYIPLLCIISFTICNLMVMWSGWNIVSKIVMLFILGYVTLIIKIGFSRNEQRKKLIMSLNILDGSWVVLYLIGISIISYNSSFGGNGNISFGADFIVVALFSSIVYLLASKLAGKNKVTNYQFQTEMAPEN